MQAAQRAAIEASTTVTAAAQTAGVPRATLVSAIERGEVDAANPQEGPPLVILADVHQWARQTRRPGPRSG